MLTQSSWGDKTLLTNLADETRENNFGFLRLLFAALVIVSHSPELVGGERSREILTRLFGTISFGEAAVDGFFLISGYLVTKSFLQSPTASLYILKRLFRILPGYFVSFLVCVFCVAPFVGAGMSVFTPHGLAQDTLDLLRLLPPDASPVFQGLHYPLLNGAMWTIAYELRLYIVIAALGLGAHSD